MTPQRTEEDVMNSGAGATTRAEFVRYQAGSQPKCDDHGPLFGARCVLPPGHHGDHEGNGNDGFGPKYWRWEGLSLTDPPPAPAVLFPEGYGVWTVEAL